MDYEKELAIDEHALDREFISQPQKFMNVAQQTADADFHRKKAKENLEVVKAEIDAAIREEAREKGEKITEKVVESRIITDQDYLDASTEVLRADHTYNVLMSAVKAFDHRKSALENLVRLYIGGYFSTPKQDSVSEKAQVDRLAEGQKERLNRRKRKKEEAK